MWRKICLYWITRVEIRAKVRNRWFLFSVICCCYLFKFLNESIWNGRKRIIKWTYMMSTHASKHWKTRLDCLNDSNNMFSVVFFFFFCEWKQHERCSNQFWYIESRIFRIYRQCGWMKRISDNQCVNENHSFAATANGMKEATHKKQIQTKQSELGLVWL